MKTELLSHFKTDPRSARRVETSGAHLKNRGLLSGGIMAKRFTDTNKWEKASFFELSNRLKLVWFYLCDRCDHAGIWEINLPLLEFHLKEKFSLSDLTDGLKDRIEVLDNHKQLSIVGFIQFQYKTPLKADNRVHKSVLDRLEVLTHGSKPLARVMLGPKDKDKDKDMDMDKEKDMKKYKDTDNSKNGFAEFTKVKNRLSGIR